MYDMSTWVWEEVVHDVHSACRWTRPHAPTTHDLDASRVRPVEPSRGPSIGTVPTRACGCSRTRDTRRKT